MIGILKPEYVFRPRQLLRRLFQGKIRGNHRIRLPWGKEIEVSGDDLVGQQIAALGLYDLVVTEALWRLADEGESAIDVGANIGYTSFVLAERIRTGRLDCFEPHPIVFERLSTNIDSLKAQGSEARFELHKQALGPIAGELPLYIPKDFETHGGESSLAASSHIDFDSKPVVVSVATLDSHVSNREVGVMEMDVEGFEFEVLRGANKAFGERRIRDCIFEEHQSYPTPVTEWFVSQGYRIYRLDRRLIRPQLLPPDSLIPRTAWTPTNYLATIEPLRAEKRFSDSGWHCLRNRP